jgi:D-proline reductase (dithiol) PrdB
MINSLKITEALIRRKRPEFRFRVFQDTTVTPLAKPLKKCKAALITTAGLHLKTDKPFDLNLKNGDSSYRILPAEVRNEDMHVSHKWYNHKFIQADLNCVSPIDRMKEYVKKGKIRSLADEHYSFMGHIYETTSLIKHSRELGKRLKKLDVDIVFLTPT